MWWSRRYPATGSRASGPSRAGAPTASQRAWAVLMERLGYTRYVAQGGDWGTAISAAMARQAPEGLLGIHVNFAQMVPLDVLGHIRNGEPAPADLSEPEKRAYEQVAFATYHRGYGVIQGTRPQTIGYSLADTPVGLAAWLLDHDATSYEHIAQLFAGQLLRRHHARRRARQHLGLLVNEYARHPRRACTGNKPRPAQISTPPPTSRSQPESRYSRRSTFKRRPAGPRRRTTT